MSSISTILSQDASGVTALKWLVIGEALTSTPAPFNATLPGHNLPVDPLFSPPQLTTPQTWQQLLCLGGKGAGAGGLEGGSSCGVVECEGWHCLDEEAGAAVLAAALWDGGAGAAHLAAAAGAAGAGAGGPAAGAAGEGTAYPPAPAAAAPGGSTSGAATAAATIPAAAGVEEGPLGWPSTVYLPSAADTTPPSTLLHLAGAWHAAMGASSSPYTCARGRWVIWGGVGSRHEQGAGSREGSNPKLLAAQCLHTSSVLCTTGMRTLSHAPCHSAEPK
jgi:hypothetical protein